MYDLIIVGGGPAALTAAIYAARKEMSFIVIAPELGGEVMNTTFVENYPGLKSITGKNLAMSFADHARQFNFKHIEDAATDVTKHGNVFKVKTYETEYESKTVIWATGSQYRTLNVPGEAELRSRGITYCSICDGPLFKGKAVAVVGGGNSGLTSVLYMLDIAKKVYLLEIDPKLRADPVLVEKAQASPNIEIMTGTKITSINGTKKVESITLSNGRSIPVDGVIVNIGSTPITEPIKKLIELDKLGYIETDINNMTKMPGLFAAGDVTNTPYKQIVISAGAGANAALAACDYVNRTG